MKKKKLEKKLKALGFQPDGGSKHERWSNGQWFVLIPRHKEISDILAKKI